MQGQGHEVVATPDTIVAAERAQGASDLLCMMPAEAQRRAVVYSAMVMLGVHGLEQLAKALGKVDNT